MEHVIQYQKRFCFNSTAVYYKSILGILPPEFYNIYYKSTPGILPPEFYAELCGVIKDELCWQPNIQEVSSCTLLPVLQPSCIAEVEPEQATAMLGDRSPWVAQGDQDGCGGYYSSTINKHLERQGFNWLTA